ncbi:MAG: universal stress protein [Nitrospiraceae bacterium]|nr:universal stress protein [Nitrospiraceae bacterium]
MEDVKRILVVCRMTRYSRKAVHYGISLSQKYGAKLYVIHVVHDPFIFGDWNLPIPNLEEEYKKAVEDAKNELRSLVAFEKKKGMQIEELVREGDPTKEVLKMITDETIDLVIMPAHEEGRLEHFLFGRSNEEILRRMPCSIMMVKSAV